MYLEKAPRIIVGLFFLITISPWIYCQVFRQNSGKESGKDKPMARKTNYGYEKRQKELAKKAKKEEKAKKKQEDELPQEESETAAEE